MEEYISSTIKKYSEERREEEITQLILENLPNIHVWVNLSIDIQKEFGTEKLESHLKEKKYEEILKFKLRDCFKGLTNEYLSKATGIIISSGNPFELIACPCCGYKTLERRNKFEICKICWWEDNGQDNSNADEVWGESNFRVSLTQARYFYLTFGIYNPEQINLKKIQEEPNKYAIGRTFEIEGEHIIEKTENWSGKVKTKR